MIFYATVLRTLAACLITNSHYGAVYPSDIFAQGGLIGDILFFAISGFCLVNIKTNFFKWYGKRLLRCYLPVIVITIIYMIIGFYRMSDHNFFWWFCYPTYYHFISSIILLYIPYYFVLKIDKLRQRIPLIMLIIGIAYLIVYIFFFDKSFYHIDVVEHWMIRFLFFESMLLGAYFRINDSKFRNKISVKKIIAFIVSLIVYFASKFYFSKFSMFQEFQLLTQITIFVLLFCTFSLFSSIDSKLQKMPNILNKIIKFLAEITLEIYLVQHGIIYYIQELGLAFPLNWIVITLIILIAAFVLHYIIKWIMKGIKFVYSKLLKIKKNLSN